jgi:putative holliday junction resolvase
MAWKNVTENDPERANLTPTPKRDKPVRHAAVFLETCASGVLLGLDPGTRTIGIAASDPTRRIATPVETIRRKKWTQDLVRLKALVLERDVVGIVLGYPLNMDDSEGPRAQSARQMGNNLIRGLGLPVLMWDERLSSFEAEEIMTEAGIGADDQAERIDRVAAAVILQGALDQFVRLG